MDRCASSSGSSESAAIRGGGNRALTCLRAPQAALRGQPGERDTRQCTRDHVKQRYADACIDRYLLPWRDSS